MRVIKTDTGLLTKETQNQSIHQGFKYKNNKIGGKRQRLKK